MKMSPIELLRRGGEWLGAARSWLQWNKRNGSDVTWGSLDEIKPPMTAADVDALAAEVAATFFPDGGPKPVVEAARIVTRWHYGSAPGQGELAPTDCVLVSRAEWEALKRAVETQPTMEPGAETSRSKR